MLREALWEKHMRRRDVGRWDKLCSTATVSVARCCVVLRVLCCVVCVSDDSRLTLALRTRGAIFKNTSNVTKM